MNDETLKEYPQEEVSSSSSKSNRLDDAKDNLEEDDELEEGSEETQLYRKDNFLIKSLIVIFGGSFAIIVILAIIGFAIGLSGGRPPAFDWSIVDNKFSEFTGNETATDPINELDKND